MDEMKKSKSMKCKCDNPYCNYGDNLCLNCGFYIDKRGLV
jgi:hypothetical protein